MERVRNGYRTGTGTRVERQQTAFCQAFPVRFLLTGAVPTPPSSTPSAYTVIHQDSITYNFIWVTKEPAVPAINDLLWWLAISVQGL